MSLERLLNKRVDRRIVNKIATLGTAVAAAKAVEMMLPKTVEAQESPQDFVEGSELNRKLMEGLSNNEWKNSSLDQAKKGFNIYNGAFDERAGQIARAPGYQGKPPYQVRPNVMAVITDAAKGFNLGDKYKYLAKSFKTPISDPKSGVGLYVVVEPEYRALEGPEGRYMNIYPNLFIDSVYGQFEEIMNAAENDNKDKNGNVIPYKAFDQAVRGVNGQLFEGIGPEKLGGAVYGDKEIFINKPGIWVVYGLLTNFDQPSPLAAYSKLDKFQAGDTGFAIVHVPEGGYAAFNNGVGGRGILLAGRGA